MGMYKARWEGEWAYTRPGGRVGERVQGQVVGWVGMYVFNHKHVLHFNTQKVLQKFDAHRPYYTVVILHLSYMIFIAVE